MCLKNTMRIYELLDCASVDGKSVAEFFSQQGAETWVKTLPGDEGCTDLVEIRIPGSEGKTAGGKAPTLCIAGSLGGVGGRPAITGIVSDADGALVALAVASKVLSMNRNGDGLKGDLVVRTTICGNAPTMEHHPVPFMNSYVDFVTLKEEIVDKAADAIIVTETSRGNRVANYPIFGITPTVKAGWILKTSEDAIDAMERVTGEPARVIPISMQDLTPVTNGVHHLNGLCEMPAGTIAPCIGVGLTSLLPISGAAPGVTSVTNLEMAVRYVLEIAKDYTAGHFSFYDETEYKFLTETYGSMSHLLTQGKNNLEVL